MKLTKDKYGSIIDQATGKTLLLNGVAIPCGNADPIAASNSEEIFKRVNQHDQLVEMNKELVEALNILVESPRKVHMGGVDIKLNPIAFAEIVETFKKAKKAKELTND